MKVTMNATYSRENDVQLRKSQLYPLRKAKDSTHPRPSLVLRDSQDVGGCMHLEQLAS